MPKAKSALKQARAGAKRNLHNATIKSRIRTGLRRFDGLLKADPKQAVVEGRQVVSWLDRAAKTQVFHRNTANRYKTRVLNQIRAIAK